MTDDALAFANTLDDGAGRTTVRGESRLSSAGSVLPTIEVVDGTPNIVRRQQPRFVLEGELGKGGLGEVVLARDEDIGRSVAIKRLRDRQASQATIARFIDEMRVTGGLDHPNVVPVHDVGLDENGDYFFIMRHVRGETLESIIRRLAADDPEAHRLFGVERRVEIFKAILEAIAYAHSRGVVHRDIKPANIMVGPFGEVVVMDWGIAKPVAAAADLATLGDAKPVSETEGRERAFATQSGALVGTPAYMAPEQVRGLEVDARTDVYALGVLLHELLYLEHYLADREKLIDVCDGVINKRLTLHLNTASKVQPMVPVDLYWYVEMALRKEPERRFQSVREMIDRLDRRAAGDIPIQCHLSATRRSMFEMLRFHARHPHLFVTIFVTAVVAVTALVAWALVTIPG